MKQYFLIGLLILLSHLATYAQNKISIQVTNFNSDKGNCKACLFNSADSFNGKTDKPFQCINIPVKNKTAQASFENIPAGSYVIFVFHDANENNKLDKN